MSAPMTREERTQRLADLRARMAARNVVLSGGPLMSLPLHRRIAFAISDPGAITPRGDDYREPIHAWQARAVGFVLPEAAELEALREQHDKLDKTLDEVLTERDAHHDALDRFALAVAPEEVIGEHSSGNNPWANAFELVTPAAEVDRLRARVAELEAQAEKVAAFCAQRAEYVTSLRNCHPDNGHDYDRWQGHAAARRQLSERLGLPVAWPAESEPRTAPVPVEDPHDSPLHHSYALGRDLPEVTP